MDIIRHHGDLCFLEVGKMIHLCSLQDQVLSGQVISHDQQVSSRIFGIIETYIFVRTEIIDHKDRRKLVYGKDVIVHLASTLPEGHIVRHCFFMKFLKDIHGIEVIYMQDHLEDIVWHKGRRKLIIDVCCFLCNVNIDSLIIRQRQQDFGFEDICLVQHVLIDRITFEYDHAFLSHMTDTPMFGIRLYHHDSGVFPFMLEVIEDQ